MSRSHLKRWLCTSLLALAGCASHVPFDTTFPLSQGDDLRELVARMHASPGSTQQPALVGVTAKPRKLFAYDLRAQRLLFSESVEVSGPPLLAGPFVVVPEGGKVRLRNLRDGTVVADVNAEGMNLIGADGDDHVSAFVLSSGGSYGAHARLVIVQDGKVTTNVKLDLNLGSPAVRAGLVFVPHGRVHLSVLSPDGRELSRVRVRDDVASEARSDGRDIFFGQAGMYRLDEQTPVGVAGGAHYFAPDPNLRRRLPGSPEFLHDTTLEPAPLDSAVHRIALSFWPDGSDGVRLANDALYLSFYRALFALTADAGGAHWARTTAADVVGMQGYAGGVVVVEESGTVSAFDDDGSTIFEAQLGLKPQYARIRADGLGASGSHPLPPLVEQLRAVASHEDTRLAPAGELAVRLLGPLSDEEASRALIELCSKPDLSRRIRDTACEQLGERKDGSDAVLTALARRNDYLRDEHAAPLAPLSRAAATAKEPRAAALLVAHLEDPSTDADDLPALVRAMIKLGDGSVVPAVARFLRMYHADASDAPLSDALVLSTQLIAAVSPDTARATLEPIASDALADPSVREAARKQLAKLPEPATETPPAAPATSEAPAEPVKQPAVPPPPPARLSAEDLASALAPVRAEVTSCVRKDPGHLTNARLTVVVEPDGSVQSVRTLPETLQSCVEPLVRRIKLPVSTFGKRETLHHTITR